MALNLMSAMIVPESKLEPYGIGVLTRGDGATTGLYTPRWTGFVWYSPVLKLLTAVGKIDRMRLYDASDMENHSPRLFPSFTKKSNVRVEMHDYP